AAVELDRALGDLAALGAQQARDRLERGGLAGAVGAEQRRDPALADVERHALEDEDHAVVDDLDVVEAQHAGSSINRRASAGRAPAPRRPAARTTTINRRASAGGGPPPRRPSARPPPSSRPPPCCSCPPR